MVGELWTISVHSRISNGKIGWCNILFILFLLSLSPSSIFLHDPGTSIIKMNRGWKYSWLRNKKSTFTSRYDGVQRRFAFCPVHQTIRSLLKNLFVASMRVFPQFLSVILLSFFPYPLWEVKGWRVGFWEEGVGGLPWWSVKRLLVPTAASRGLCIWVL